MPKTIWPALLLISLFSIASSGSEISEAQQEARQLREFLDSTINHSDSFPDRFDAEVWLVDMSSRLERFIPTNHQARLSLLRLIHQHATRSKLPPELVLAVIEVESSFDPYAVSRVGAQGLMQVMPFWKEEIGRPQDNLTRIDTNLNYGCRILQFYLQKEQGKLLDALARYNGSSNYRYSHKVRRAWRDHWRTETLNWKQ